MFIKRRNIHFTTAVAPIESFVLTHVEMVSLTNIMVWALELLTWKSHLDDALLILDILSVQ